MTFLVIQSTLKVLGSLLLMTWLYQSLKSADRALLEMHSYTPPHRLGAFLALSLVFLIITLAIWI